MVSDVAGSKNDMSDDAYAQQLMEMYGSDYNSFMNEAMGIVSDSRYGMMDVIPEKYAIEAVEDNGRVEYYAFDCVLNDENDAGMSNDEFLFYVNSGDMCAFFAHLTVSEERTNPDAVNELNFWLKESREIMNDPHIDDDHKFGMLPHKDLVIEIESVDNLIIPGKYVLNGSRVIDMDNRNNFAFITTRIDRFE